MELKQVLIVRRDLKLSKGKLATQVAHAAVSAAELCRRYYPRLYQEWIRTGQKKVVLQVPDLETLQRLEKIFLRYTKAVVLIRDAGRTQIAPGTITVLGVGPHKSKEIEAVTSILKLL